MDLADLKQMVERENLVGLQEYIQLVLLGESDSDAEWDYLFQKVYLHACLKKKVVIAEWLEKGVFPQIPLIQAMAIRQVFPYGRYLLRNK
jgi:hypothetical protein